MNTARIVFSTSIVLLSAARIHAAPVPLNSPIATFDQGGAFTIGSTLDGIIVDTNSGWGVFGGQFTDQTAFWQPTSPVNSPDGLIFTMPQFYVDGRHFIQKFRLSMTTDAAPSLGGNWLQLSPNLTFASGGVTLSNIGDNTIFASGAAGRTTYRVGTSGPVTGATGFRLELFPYDYDPLDAVAPSLGFGSNGNLVLSQFMVDTPSGYNWALGGSPTSNFATYPGQGTEFLVDGFLNNQSHPADPPAQNGFFFTVDLGGTVDLTSIDLFNRTGCCPERLSNYRVQVLDSLFTSVWSGDFHTDGSNSGSGGIDSITEGQGTGLFEGRYVRITNLSGMAYNPQISEVRAFGTAVPEPGSASLAALGGLCLMRRRRNK